MYLYLKQTMFYQSTRFNKKMQAKNFISAFVREVSNRKCAEGVIKN